MPQPDIDQHLKVLPNGDVLDTISEEPEILTECYCHNGHEQSDTVCSFCWAHGRRRWADPDIPGVTD